MEANSELISLASIGLAIFAAATGGAPAFLLVVASWLLGVGFVLVRQAEIEERK